GNITLAATHLGLPRNTLRYRLAKLGVELQGHREANGSEAEPAATRATITKAHSPKKKPDPRGDVTRRVIAFLGAGVPEECDGPLEREEILSTIVSKVQDLGGRIESIRENSLVSTFGVYPCQDAIERAARAAVALPLALKDR